MSSGLITNRDWVKGLKGQGKDWHGKTIEVETITREIFPELFPVELIASGNDLPKKTENIKTGFKMLINGQDGLPIGIPYNPDTFKIIHPRNGFDLVIEALQGTGYTVERAGMLWDGGFWFVSIHLAELAKVARKGEKFQLNFSAALTGTDAFEGELSHIRAVCWNTISASRATGQKLFKVKQTRFSKSKLDGVTAEVEKAVGMARIFNETMVSLENTPATENEARLVYAGALAQAGAKFERTELKRTVDAGNGLFRKEGTGEFRENRAVNLIDGALVPAFRSGDGNKGKTRADVLNGFTQVFTRGGGEDSTKDEMTALESSDFSGNADRKAEFFAALSRPEKRDGKKIIAPDGWSELLTDGKKALELAKAL